MTSEQSEAQTTLCAAAQREQQAQLYNLCFDKTDGERVIAWRYDENPHAESVSLLSTVAGEVASGYACNPRRAWAYGKDEAVVGQTGDVMTAPDFRGKGLFSALDRAALEETRARGWTHVFGLPNRNSERLFTEKLGWDLVGKIRPWTFVLTTDDDARAERMRAGRLAAAAVPWTYWRGMRSRGKLRNRAWGKVNTVAIARFAPDVDELARTVARDYAWMVRRDHAYLNWRFLDAPSGLFRAHGVYASDGELRGYSIVQLPRSGERVAYVVDVLALDDVAFAAALDGALGHLHKASASVARAHAIEGSAWERALKTSGFRAGKAADFKAVIAYVHDEQHPLAQVARRPQDWFFTDGDRDDETVR